MVERPDSNVVNYCRWEGREIEGRKGGREVERKQKIDGRMDGCDLQKGPDGIRFVPQFLTFNLFRHLF